MNHALVTGACGGIGRATVRAFLDEGWVVTGVDRQAAPEDFETSDFLQLDIQDDRSLNAIAALFSKQPLHALVNNAAITASGTMDMLDPRTFDEVVATNLRAPFRLTGMLQKSLALATGAVVNVSSVHAVATSLNAAAYATTKGGLSAFTRAAAIELATDGIRCNGVLPGATQTSMLEEGFSRLAEADSAEARRAFLRERTPLGRIGRPEEVAQAILFLADPQRSSYVTGQLLAVDGGVLARLASE